MTVFNIDSRYFLQVIYGLKTQVVMLERPRLRSGDRVCLSVDNVLVKGRYVLIKSIHTSTLEGIKGTDIVAEGFLHKEHFKKDLLRDHPELKEDSRLFLVNFQVIDLQVIENVL